MTVGFEAITQALPGIASKIMYWIGYFLFAIVMGVGCYAFYYYNQFKIRMTYWNIYGNAKDGYSVDKPKKLRFKFNRERTGWVQPFKKKTIEPFDSKYIYPGNNVYAFKYGDNFLPARMNFDETVNIEPVPYYVKNWHLIELKQNEIEFQKSDWWTHNKTLIIALCVSLGCLGLCAITVYYCLRTTQSAVSEIKTTIPVMKQLIGNIGGMAPK